MDTWVLLEIHACYCGALNIYLSNVKQELISSTSTTTKAVRVLILVHRV